MSSDWSRWETLGEGQSTQSIPDVYWWSLISYHLMILMGGEKNKLLMVQRSLPPGMLFKLCKSWIKLSINWCRISSINSTFWDFRFGFALLLFHRFLRPERRTCEKKHLGRVLSSRRWVFFFDVVLSIDIHWATTCSSLGKSGFPFLTLIISSFYVCYVSATKSSQSSPLMTLSFA